MENTLNGGKRGTKKQKAILSTEKNGLLTVWYRDGQKFGEVNMKDGKAHGRGIFWNKDGKKWAEENFENDLHNGKSRSWYPSGVLSSEVCHDHNKIIKCSQFSEDGIAVYENEISPAICTGIVRRFYSTSLDSSMPE
jgi:antitoxin component YwqK of YwqJK toxin-antitoxin module